MNYIARLSRPDLAIAAVHDGRHRLADKPLARESIPYIVPLPEHGIAFFTYTWVNKAGEAGAAIAVFGPGVSGEAIQQRLADRPVSIDMDFDDWVIDGFTMKQDLKFGSAHIHWETPEAMVDFAFEASHPPYAYGTHAQGCPPYAADDRVEQAGRVKGTLRLGDRVIDFDATGHRDHSWGTRDWLAMQHYKWFVGQVGSDIAINFWEIQALGRTVVRGYVFKDGLMAEVTDVQISHDYDDDMWHTRYAATIGDDAGRTTKISAEVFARYTLIPDPDMWLRETGARAVIDGRNGVGWMEFGWPKAYLEHLAKTGPY